MKYIQNITKRARILSTDRTNNVKQKKKYSKTQKERKSKREFESKLSSHCVSAVYIEFIYADVRAHK